jgi:hypothetical protein
MEKRTVLLTDLCHHSYAVFYMYDIFTIARESRRFLGFNCRIEQLLSHFLQVFDDFLSVFGCFYTKIVWNLFPVDSFFDQFNAFTVHPYSKNEQEGAQPVLTFAGRSPIGLQGIIK